jgi:hypothetical protein
VFPAKEQFPEADRLIFAYTVRDKSAPGGQRKVFADPLAIRRRMIVAGGGYLNEVLREAGTPDPDASQGEQPLEPAAILVREQARENRYKIVCEAFGLIPVDETSGEGITETEAMAILGEYLDWLSGESKPGGTKPTTSASTGSLPATSTTTMPTSVSR